MIPILQLPVSRLILPVAFVLCFGISACQKELSNGLASNNTSPDLVTKIASSVSGFVTDETKAAVEGAFVQFGSQTAVTDKFGYFGFSNIQVVKNAAVVTVTKPGYFKGIKTYVATENKGAFFHIQLLPKTTAGSFDAATGGTVSLANGLSVSFPAAAIKLATGGVYNGQVNIAAQWIDPTGNDLVNTMPGDLRGLDSAGMLKLLTTYGMAAVELTGGAGELLQVAEGKKATLSFPLPASIAGSAPANIPLWSFNESNGLWKQEGHAVRSGSNYVGEVTHFSFWNCDLPIPWVQMRLTVKNADGMAIPGAIVKIKALNNPQFNISALTDSSGFLAGGVPANSALQVQVIGSMDCSNELYAQNFTSSNQDIDLGIITVPATGTATLNGTIINCTGEPVGQGCIVITRGNYVFRYSPNIHGTFNLVLPLCNTTDIIQLMVLDFETAQGSNPINLSVTSGIHNTGLLSACGVQLQEYVSCNMNGMNWNYFPPRDLIRHSLQDSTLPGISEILATDNVGADNEIRFSFTQNNIAAGSEQELTDIFAFHLGLNSATVAGASAVHITEYGAVGEYIAGHFSSVFGHITTPTSPPNVFTCRFRIKRQQ